LRERLVGSGVLGSDDLAVTELVLNELADEIVLERFGKIFGRVRIGDFDPLVKIVRRDHVALRQLVEPRVLKVPDRSRLPDRAAGETDDAWFLTDDLCVLADLTFCCRAFFLGDIGRQREFRDFATHVMR
jgi:hypothetical protein